MYLVLDEIPALQKTGKGFELSFLIPKSKKKLSKMLFYMNNIFIDTKDFDEMYAFLVDHFFPKIFWFIFKLFFKKIHLLEISILTLNLTYNTDGKIKIKKERVCLIKIWPIPIYTLNISKFRNIISIICC